MLDGTRLLSPTTIFFRGSGPPDAAAAGLGSGFPSGSGRHCSAFPHEAPRERGTPGRSDIGSRKRRRSSGLEKENREERGRGRRLGIELLLGPIQGCAQGEKYDT